MEVILIVAVSSANNGIGKNNDLLWNLPEDMKFFRSQTTGFPVITGRKNYESIPERFRPLPNRENIVVTRQNIQYEGANVCSSIKEAIEIASLYQKDKIFIIGGGQIYKQCLEQDLVDKLIITWVDADIEADVFFPILDAKWKIISQIRNNADNKNAYPYTFTEYIKSKQQL
jgi:dihydrofolate reductase